ncbi:MAG: hypothetical protein GKR89_04975 [Candidatus Latescibacteria bacterium]|nr:hypothetical protein [Candidatus Latescibacterota bacterium]
MRKVYMGTDLEGVAGVVSFEQQSWAEARYYDAARKLLTGEINAAVEGLITRGVEDILVVDGHGPGAVYFEDLHPEAKLLHGRPAAPRSVRDPIVAGYDACLMIGQHARAGLARSNQNHTQSSKTTDYIKINGRVVGEIAQFALYQGALGLPFFFLCGEEAACREAEELVPGITTVAVKQGLSRGSAISLAAPRARGLIREGIEEAVQRQRAEPLPPLRWEGPFVQERRYFTTDHADAAAAIPGHERIDDQTVRFASENILDVIYR